MAATGPQDQGASTHPDQEHPVTLSLSLVHHAMIVDANKLARRSDFFKTVLETERREGQPFVVRLREIERQTMTNYIHFVDSGRLPTTNIVNRVDNVDLVTAGISYGNLASLYVLGEKLADGDLKNAVVGEIVRVSTMFNAAVEAGFPGRHIVNPIYAVAPPNAPVRRLLVDMHTRFGHAHYLDATNPTYFEGFVRDLARELLEKAANNEAPESYRMQPLNAADYIA